MTDLNILECIVRLISDRNILSPSRFERVFYEDLVVSYLAICAISIEVNKHSAR